MISYKKGELMKKYIGIFIVVFVGYMIGNSIYIQINKDPTPGKAKRFPCQAKTTTFEKGYSPAEIKIAQELLTQGGVSFKSSVEKSVYESSKLFDHIKLADMDKVMQKALDSYVTVSKYKDGKNPLKVSYYIYENDIKDPGKKTKKSKLYAGYVVLQIKNNKNRVIYKVQIDFMDFQGSDISSKIECSIKSFMTYNK